MKKMFLVLAVLATLFIGASTQAQAANCGEQFNFQVYKWNGVRYDLVMTTTSSGLVISYIQTQPYPSGYIRGRDLVCDGYQFWNYANGTYWDSRS